MLQEAAKPLAANPKLCNLSIKKSYEQIIDTQSSKFSGLPTK
ncbi:MAG: hypothetical protein ABI076_04890 [Acidobacteriaceae bacterium]